MASRPSTPAAAPAKSAAAPAAQPPTRGAQRGRAGPASRGGRYYQRGGKSASRENQNGDVTAEDPSGDAPRKRCAYHLLSSRSCSLFTLVCLN